jgi:hypothetical protein
MRETPPGSANLHTSPEVVRRRIGASRTISLDGGATVALGGSLLETLALVALIALSLKRRVLLAAGTCTTPQNEAVHVHSSST